MQTFHYPCPCGDRFEITRVRTFFLLARPTRADPLFVAQSQLSKGEEIATCPSCSLIVRVVYDMVRFNSPFAMTAD